MPRDTLKKIRSDFEGKAADLVPVLQRVQGAEGHLSAGAVRSV